MSEISEQLERDKKAVAESEAAARDTLAAVLPILTALAQWARIHADRAGEALVEDGREKMSDWSNHAEFRRNDLEEWIPRVEGWVRTLRREVGPEVGDREAIEVRAMELAELLASTRGRRGRDFIRGLKFGEVLDLLDAKAAKP